MLDSTLSQLAAQWFNEYHRLAYWLARRIARRSLDYRGRTRCGSFKVSLWFDHCAGFGA